MLILATDTVAICNTVGNGTNVLRRCASLPDGSGAYDRDSAA